MMLRSWMTYKQIWIKKTKTKQSFKGNTVVYFASAQQETPIWGRNLPYCLCVCPVWCFITQASFNTSSLMCVMTLRPSAKPKLASENTSSWISGRRWPQTFSAWQQHSQSPLKLMLGLTQGGREREREGTKVWTRKLPHGLLRWIHCTWERRKKDIWILTRVLKAEAWILSGKFALLGGGFMPPVF